MLERKILIRTLKYYCDVIWEYDLRKNMIYIHSDSIAEAHENRWYTAEELIHIFKTEYNFKASEITEKAYLNGEFPRGFFACSDTEEFQMKFATGKNSVKWYHIRVERLDETRLIISGRDIFEEIKERALYKAAKKSFDRILSIDTGTGTYIVGHDRTRPDIPAHEFDYDSKMRSFVYEKVVGDDRQQLIQNLSLDYVKKVLRTEDEHIVFTTVHDENENILYKKMAFSYGDDAGRIITLSQIDVSSTVEKYEDKIREFRKANYIDALTGAYNRNYYETNVKNQTLKAGVAVIDIDDFKVHNDVYGHKAGDMVLAEITTLIKSLIGEEDRLIRSGGDEFILIIENPDSEYFEHTLKQLQKQVHMLRIDRYPDLRMSVSVGGVIAAEETIEAAAARADRFMYQAKVSKNMVVTENNCVRAEEKADIAFDRDKNRQQILIIDDSEFNRMMLTEMLQEDFRILEAADGIEGLEIMKTCGQDIALVLLDIIMPEIDGFQVLEEMNKTHMIEDIPVVMITSDATDSNIRKAYDMGVSDYIARPFDSRVVYRRVANTIKLYAKQKRLVSIIVNQSKAKEKHNSMMVEILSRVVSYRDGESEMHIQGINRITELLLEKLSSKYPEYRLSGPECQRISKAAMLHDIGNIGIDKRLLDKQGELTDSELETVKTHTVRGELFIRSFENYEYEPFLKTAAQICRWHHERYDGSGYPDGLKGDEIPVAVQMVSIADVYDSLICRQPYREAYSCEEAFNMIAEGRCGSFNPLMVECLGEIIGSLKNIY